MKRPCTCNRVTSSVWDSSQCRLCWLVQFDQRYADLFMGGGIKTIKINRRDNCENLGKVLERAACNCPGKWVHACALHERCRTGTSNDGVRSCLSCSDYQKD